MIKIKLNKKLFSIPQVSELTFNQWNEVFIKAKVTNLENYLAVFTDLSVEKIMKSEFKGDSLPMIQALIFNVDQSKALEKKEIFTHNMNGKKEYVLLNTLDFKSFGALYHYEIYRGAEINGKINRYELALYAMAIALSDKKEDTIESIYKKLSDMPWQLVLPHAFFLNKKFVRWRIQRLALSIGFTLELKWIQLMTKRSERKLRESERI